MLNVLGRESTYGHNIGWWAQYVQFAGIGL